MSTKREINRKVVIVTYDELEDAVRILSFWQIGI